MIGCGAHFQVPGLSHQEPGTGAQVRVRVQVIGPLSSIQPSTHSRWQVAAPGDRWRAFPFSPPCSAQRSPQRSPPFCHPFCHPFCPRFIHPSFRVPGDSPRWRVAGLIHSALHAVLNAALNSVLRGLICPPSSVIDSAIDSFQVAGGGPRGISLSGVGNQPSAVGFRLQRPPSEIS
jgi:hypothetical protein